MRTSIGGNALQQHIEMKAYAESIYLANHFLRRGFVFIEYPQIMASRRVSEIFMWNRRKGSESGHVLLATSSILV